jgi:hypothetical protein
MSMANVPNALVDNEYELFPEGTFIGKLTGAKTRTFDSGDQILNLSFGSTMPATEEDPETGGRAFTGRVQLKRQGLSILDIADFGPNVPFPLRRAGGLLAGMAEAVGAGVRGEDGVAVDLGEFIDALIEGDYENANAKFRVVHNSWTRDDPATGQSVTTNRDEFLQIAPA